MRENWRPIENIYLDYPGYDCFVCSPHHAAGFRLEFFHDPDEDVVVAPVDPRGRGYDGYPGILHGGFQTMLMDETMGWAAMHLAGRIVFTAKLETGFVKPVRTTGTMLAKARVQKAGKRLIRLEGWLEDAEGEVLAKAEGAFFVPNREEFMAATGASEVPAKYQPYLR